MHLTTTLKRFLEQPEPARRVGPFVLIRQLGRGGFAPVWLAREVYADTELRLAAVKLFSTSVGTSTAFSEQVIEEARTLCQVEHPNIVRFYSIASDDAVGVFGVAMEYLSGTPLDERLMNGPLSIDETLVVGTSIASALAAVHRAGLVHRDVKPANIVDSGGTYKLIDFGIAWAAQNSAAAADMMVLIDDLPVEVPVDARKDLRDARTIRFPAGSLSGSRRSGSYERYSGGTIGYVDPVTARGESSVPASDLYALGIVLFECIVGKHPAVVAAPEGEGLNELVLAGLSPTPRVCEVAPKTPAALGKLVDSLLAVERSERPHSAEWVAIELERIRGEQIGANRHLPPENIGPFRGLARFEAEDRDVYFGRSSEIAAAIELMRTHGVVALIGPSGSGKSSLARAGVLPRIAQGALARWPKEWDAVITEPGHDAKAAIMTGCHALGGEVAALLDAEPDRFAEAMGTYAKSRDRGIVLFIDQLEELVTVSESRSRRWVAELLSILGQAPLPGVRVLVTARRDLLDPLLAVGRLSKTLVRGSLFVEPITDATWGEVLQQALDAYGYSLEDDAMAAELLAELRGTASAMPLVQFALSELWQKRDTQTKRIPRAGLKAIGGIAGSLERHAERTLAHLTSRGAEVEPLTRELLLALTTPKGTRAARRIADLVEPAGPKRNVQLLILDTLEQARLIVRGSEEITLTHEALLTQWRRLRDWVEEAREERQLAEEIERDATRWSSEPDGVAPWRKRRLAQALTVASSGRVALSETARRFLDAGRRSERRSRVAVLVGGLSAAALVGVGVVGYVASVRARERSALERVAFEQSKSALEQEKRLELERAQSDLSERQRTIDELVQKLAAAQDQDTIRDLTQQMNDAQRGAHAAQGRISAAIRAREPTAPAAATTQAGAPTQTASPVRPKYQTD